MKNKKIERERKCLGAVLRLSQPRAIHSHPGCFDLSKRPCA